MIFIIVNCGGGAGGDNPGNIPVTGVEITGNISIAIGNSEQLAADILPSGATNTGITWTTSDAGKAVVSADGTITAVGISAGTVTITVQTEDGGFTDNCLVTVNAAPVFTADGISFRMGFVAGAAFPVNSDDSSTATVSDSYWIGETEVTYGLWNKVCSWAVLNGYTFVNPGTKGNDGASDKTDNHPVTMISWRDSVVFCNALTEWYNANAGTSYTCVYKKDGSPIRNSNLSDCENAVPVDTATGFRMLTRNEWELAARWRNDSINTVAGYSMPWFTRGNSASGATKNYNVGDTDTIDFAVYSANASLSTSAAGSRTSNSLGLYDMSGNVSELFFDNVQIPGGVLSIRYFYVMGGDWSNSAAYTQVGNYYLICTWNDSVIGTPCYMQKFNNMGLRIARSNL